MELKFPNLLSNPSWSEDSTDSKDEAVRHFENSDGAHVRYQTHRLPYGRMSQSFRQDLAGVYGLWLEREHGSSNNFLTVGQ